MGSPALVGREPLEGPEPLEVSFRVRLLFCSPNEVSVQPSGLVPRPGNEEVTSVLSGL